MYLRDFAFLNNATVSRSKIQNICSFNFMIFLEEPLISLVVHFIILLDRDEKKISIKLVNLFDHSSEKERDTVVEKPHLVQLKDA